MTAVQEATTAVAISAVINVSRNLRRSPPPEEQCERPEGGQGDPAGQVVGDGQRRETELQRTMRRQGRSRGLSKARVSR